MISFMEILQTAQVNKDDLKVKKWLENHRIKDVPFVTVPDPNFKYDGYGTDWDPGTSSVQMPHWV